MATCTPGNNINVRHGALKSWRQPLTVPVDTQRFAYTLPAAMTISQDDGWDVDPRQPSNITARPHTITPTEKEEPGA